MSHSHKRRVSGYDRLKYMNNIKRKEETNDRYSVSMDLKNGEGLVVDVTSNKLHYDRSESVRRRMLKNLCQQHGAEAGVLIRIDQQGVKHVMEQWRYKA